MSRFSALQTWSPELPPAPFGRVLKRSGLKKKTNRFWAPFNPHDVIQCKKAHGKKAMCWVGTVDGRCLPVVWFEGSVDSKVYLERVLKGAVWPSVRGVATRKQYWFQQDGASCHVTEECLDFIESKFGGQVM